MKLEVIDGVTTEWAGKEIRIVFSNRYGEKSSFRMTPASAVVVIDCLLETLETGNLDASAMLTARRKKRKPPK